MEPASEAKGIEHGSGMMWSFGTPFDEWVWSSEEYEETSYEVDGQRVVDARGKSPNGRRWRHLGRFGETAVYSETDEAAAKVLDKVLDGVCVK